MPDDRLDEQARERRGDPKCRQDRRRSIPATGRSATCSRSEARNRSGCRKSRTRCSIGRQRTAAVFPGSCGLSIRLSPLPKRGQAGTAARAAQSQLGRTLDSRTVSRTGSRWSCALPVSIDWISVSISASAARRESWVTVVSGGLASDAAGMSSNPTTAVSGTLRPTCCKACIAPIAATSLAANIASKSTHFEISCSIAARPSASLGAASARQLSSGSIPAARSARQYPRQRSCTSGKPGRQCR